MVWYKDKGEKSDVVISSRVRMARNIADYPFYNKIDAAGASAVIEKVRKSIGDGLEYIDFAKLSPVQAASYVEKHYVSPEFVSSELPHALLIDEDKGIAVMLCEEDHIRLQCIRAGLALDEAFKTACGLDDKLCDSLNVACDEKLGFLTHCPTNLGTAMRASVMLFLPALTMTGKISQLSGYLPKIGLTMRGMYGEGSEAEGAMYQISNRVTLGLTEEEIIAKLRETINQIIEMEHRERDTIRSDSADRIYDAVCRSYGIIANARLMTSSEFMKLFADVRLGIALGCITNVSYEKLGELMIAIQPATLNLANGGELDDLSRDRARAQLLRDTLNALK